MIIEMCCRFFVSSPLGPVTLTILDLMSTVTPAGTSSDSSFWIDLMFACFV